MNSFTLIRKNLTRRKLRTSLMLLCTMTAFLIFGILGAFMESFNLKGQVGAAERMVVANETSILQPLPISYLSRIERVEDVATVSPVRMTFAYIGDPSTSFGVNFVAPEQYLSLYPKLDLSDEHRQAFLQDRNSLLIGQSKADELGVSVGDQFSFQTFNEFREDGSKDWTFTVAGVFSSDVPGEDMGILGHYDRFNQGLAFGRDSASWFLLSAADPDNSAALAAEIDGLFANSPNTTRTQEESAFAREMLDQMGNVNLILRLVVSAAFIAILAVVGNTMFFAVRQRTRELGTLRAMGFSKSHLLAMVGGETVLLVLLGALMGLGLAWLLVSAIAVPLESIIPGLAVSGTVMAAACGLAVIFGLVVGMAPAFMTYRLNIVEALGRK